MSRPYNQILLEDIAIPKGIQTGPFGSQLKAEEYVDVGIPVVMPKDILGGFLSSETVARISETKARKLKKHKIISGDIIFPRRGIYGGLVLLVMKTMAGYAAVAVLEPG